MKRYIIPGAAMAAFGAIWLSVAYAQVVPPAAISEGSAVAWDHDGLDTEGNPLPVVRAEIELRTPAGDPQKQLIVDVGPSGPPPFALEAFLSGVPEGEYVLRVRLQGQNGVWSGYAPPLSVAVNRAAPTVPRNVRIEIQVNVTVGG